MKYDTPLNLILHYPETKEGNEILKQHISSIYADIVIEKIQNLHCSTQQKLELLDAIVEKISSEK